MITKERQREISKKSAAKIRSAWTVEQKEAHRKKCLEYNQAPHAKSRRRARELKKKFGITVEKYNELFSAQAGRCAICGRHQTEFKKSLVVDHDHKTNEVRGLLCNKCNVGLGQFYDSIEIVTEALHYLQQSKPGDD